MIIKWFQAEGCMFPKTYIYGFSAIKRAPVPCLAAISSGLKIWQARSDKHPHPIQPSSASRRRMSWSIFSFRSFLKISEILRQSSAVGVRWADRLENSSFMRGRENPKVCAALIRKHAWCQISKNVAVHLCCDLTRSSRAFHNISKRRLLHRCDGVKPRSKFLSKWA